MTEKSLPRAFSGGSRDKRLRFFSSSLGFQRWLQRNHGTAREIIVGFHKISSGKKGLTYAEALDEALCAGWIDGVRRSLDADSYTIRFSPRKARSIWSRVNLNHVERLTKAGRMTSAGLSVHAQRDHAKCGIYSFENRPGKLEPTDESTFKANPKAWDYFQRQAPSYQRTAIWWVVSAKRTETRARRLSQLIADSGAGRKIAQFISSKPLRTKVS